MLPIGVNDFSTDETLLLCDMEDARGIFVQNGFLCRFFHEGVDFFDVVRKVDPADFHGCFFQPSEFEPSMPLIVFDVGKGRFDIYPSLFSQFDSFFTGEVGAGLLFEKF